MFCMDQRVMDKLVEIVFEENNYEAKRDKYNIYIRWFIPDKKMYLKPKHY